MAVTLESLKKSVGKKNSKSKIFAWLADMELAAGDVDTALQRVNGGLTLYPDDISAKLVRAKILFQKEEYEECVQECNSLLVKDPFNLAGQKIMGDAYDRLGKVVERNLCYRRYHDMDPLNKFWKDEYDVIPESAVAAEAAAIAGAVDGEFSLPAEGDDSLNFNLSDGLGLDESADAGLFDKSGSEDDLFNTSSRDSVEEQSLGGSLFEKSSSSDDSFEKAFGDTFGADSDDAISEDSSSLFGSEESAGQTSSAGLGFLDSEEQNEASSSDDDPFAALAAMLPNNDAGDDATIEELAASLDSAMDSIKAEDDFSKPIEEFPADDNVSGNDVNAALSDMFGLDDDLEAEETPAQKPADFSAAVVDETAEENASKIFESQSTASADKPLSVDDAFNSIFGEDELPEESTEAFSPASAEPVPAEADPAPVEAESAFEKSAEVSSLDIPAEIEESVESATPAESIEVAPAAAPAADKPLSVDDAFDSIFGEDELPDETSSEGSLFEKSADADFSTTSLPSLDEEPAVAEPVEVAPAEIAPVEETPAADKPFGGVDDAFDSIFGEDDLPEEAPAEAPVLEEKAEESELTLDDDSSDLSFDKSVELTDAVSTFVPEVDEPSDPVIASPMDFVNDESEVGSAFSSIFGNDDDLPEEKVESTSVETLNEVPAVEDSLVEQVNKAESELEMPSIAEKPDTSDIAQEMGGAFASMFGDDDELDLPDMKSDAPSSDGELESVQQQTSAAMEENFQESAPDKLESDLNKSFDSLFGDDDDLVIPTESTPADVENIVEGPAAGNPDLTTLENEVSGAFKGLFDMEDDSLTDEAKPSNSGVDFLMSGDSDDEISAGLVKNPDAPLDRGALDLDDSMGTRTLAEIYFDQGLYADALKMYQELVQREPTNEELTTRKDEIEKIFREKFGGNA